MPLLGGFRQLPVELAPLLFRPPQLLDRGGQVEEVHRDDRRARPEVGIPDERIQLPPGLRYAGVDLAKSL